MSFARSAPMALRSLRAAAAPAFRATPLPVARTFTSATPARMVVSSVRYEAQPKGRSAWAHEPIIKYDELKPITQQPSDHVLLIDVREPDEVALGTIPSAVNLPLSRIATALDPHTNPGDFQKEFAFSKPGFDQNIIFFCRSGKRSASASEVANINGYRNVRNYEGSWLDWSKREGERKDEDD
ncbi:hypothetical protein IAT38_007705 [Cryptococcus sp. DSM 104549]